MKGISPEKAGNQSIGRLRKASSREASLYHCG